MYDLCHLIDSGVYLMLAVLEQSVCHGLKYYLMLRCPLSMLKTLPNRKINKEVMPITMSNMCTDLHIKSRREKERNLR